MHPRWLVAALAGAVSCAAARTARPPSTDFDTSVGSHPVLATGPVADGGEDAGPARNPPDASARDADAVIVAPPEDAGQQIVERPPPPPPDTAPEQQILVPEAWRRCKRDDDCTLVSAPCATERVIAVNRRFEQDMENGVTHACGDWRTGIGEVPRCAAGRCAAISPAPRPPTRSE